MSREYPCVYYDNQKCKKFEEPGYTSWCVLGPCSHETPSTADRIRIMSDEELAGQFTLIAKVAVSAFADYDLPDEICERLWSQFLENLKQPAEEGKTDA